jgi:hypothetical protein
MARMTMTAIPRLVLTYGIKNAGVGMGKIKYNKKTTNNTTSNGDTELMDGNFIFYSS